MDRTKMSLEIVFKGPDNAVRYIGQITGETTTEDMLTRTALGAGSARPSEPKFAKRRTVVEFPTTIRPLATDHCL